MPLPNCNSLSLIFFPQKLDEHLKALGFQEGCRADYLEGSTPLRVPTKTTRHTREKTAIIKGVNDSFAQYWGFVMSLITHFNKHISPRRARVRTGPPSTVCYFH